MDKIFSSKKSIKGRGANQNPASRFDQISTFPDEDWGEPSPQNPATGITRDSTKSIITYNDSPDVGFSAGINPYRGCEHGCIYCFARPNHEYLGLSAGLDFETKIQVKSEAPKLLEKELKSKRWSPQVIGLSGATDPYQPLERKWQLTRKCLKVLLHFRNPVAIITKNKLVTRDIDLLKELHQFRSVLVFISVTTMSNSLSQKMEPRASQPQDRLEAIRGLRKAGIPVGVLVAPIIPALTDQEIPEILAKCAKAGAQCARYIMVRLPHAVKDLFEEWLVRHFPERKEKILKRIRDMRGGRLNDPNFQSRMKGQGPYAEQIKNMFRISSDKANISNNLPELSTKNFRKRYPAQLTFFDKRQR